MPRRKYSREKLYKEVWQEPVRKVAERYGVSDVAIHKICKSMNIPTPPRGYWNKVAVGAVLKKKPLPKNTKKTIIMGYYSEPVDEQTKNVMSSRLEFLNSEEKEEVVSVCSNLDIYKEDHFCSLVVSHKKKVLEWNKNHPLEYGREVIQDRWRRAKKPLSAGEVSEEQLDRVFKILDVLCRSLLHLGCKILPDLSFEIRGGKAKIEIFEMQERRPHTLTESEQKQLQKYREDQEEYEIRKKLGHSVYLGTEPTFKEYDYIFNGRLRLTVGERKRFFEDEKEKHRIENRIGEVIVALHKQAELSRLEREKKEQKEKFEAEEEKRKHLLEEKIEQERKDVDQLIKEANDWKTACLIREYVNAVEKESDGFENQDEIKAWIKWARKKANEYDSSITKILKE